MTHNAHEMFSLVTSLVRNFEGREYSGEITTDTCFFADLGFASIDAVVLAELLETRLGRSISFATLVERLSRAGAQDITVGQLVDFLVE